jgi:hypothetical protein
MTRFLAACRYLLIVPVIGCIILTAGTVLMGIVRIITAGAKLVSAGDFSAKAAKIMALSSALWWRPWRWRFSARLPDRMSRRHC